MAEVYVILVATGLVGAICSSLAGLLVLAERYLADYGQCSIDINEGAKRLEVRGGQSLLASLSEEGVFIPSACGGRGTCAYCKLKIMEGGGQIVPTEESLLSEEERAENVRLSCQVKVRNDVAVVVPEELFLVKEYRGRVEKIRNLTYDIRELRIRLLEPAAIEFTPGQYIQLEAPPYGHVPESIYRAYSIASPPSDEGNIELIIRLAEDGTCTTWVFNLLKEGQEVSFNGPYGHFGLNKSDRPMVWIAGGSGMAPFWSMIRDLKEKNVQRECTFFFGALQKRDLLLTDEFEQLEKELPWLHFIPALSEPGAADEWSGERGLITEVVDRHLPDCSGQEFYLCGGGGMIDAAVKLLKSKGVGEDRIFYDKFT